MASFRNLILVSSCSLRRSLFCIFFDLFSKSNRGYILHGNPLFFFWIIQILYRCYQYWGKNQDGERKKTVTKSTHKYRQNRWGVELRPQLHVRRRVLPLHLQTVSSPPPSKVSDEYLGSIDCRSYHYADWLVTQLRSLRHHGKV